MREGMATRLPDDRKPPRRRRLGISFRTLTAVVTVSLVADQVELQLVLEARNLAVLAGDALLSDYPELTLVPLVRELSRSRPELDGIVVLDFNGRVQGHTDPRQVGRIWTGPAGSGAAEWRSFLNRGETMTFSDERIQVKAPVIHNIEGTLGSVVVGIKRSHITAQIQEARTPLFVIAAFILLLAIVLITGLLSVFFRPIKDLEAGLIRIGHGDLETPMPLNGPSEFSRLAGTLNQMVQQLKSSRALAEDREQEIIETQREVITTLGDVVESRSRETANHTRRVGAMSRDLALLAGLDGEEADLLRLASPMHDVGKIGIPDSILNKPGKLTPEEYRLMQTHAMIGYEILKGSQRPIMKAAAVIARDHHERWDGTGYPNRTAGEDIHVYGRITALVDVFDALASDRVYRPAMPLDEVLEIVHEGRGTHFDPRLVDLFLANLDSFIAIRNQFADRPNDRPVARLVRLEEGELLEV
jgi:HD-GYP domain-containing protein (c-di-GMP phosphodiesterase class II)